MSKNPQFIQWKKDMEKKYPFDLIVHCPKCNSYFPNEADFDCSCKRCGFKFCFGCKRYDCGTANCIRAWIIVFHFFGLKIYRDKNIILKILMYFAMLFQILFTFPLQVIYKIGPQLVGIDGFYGEKVNIKIIEKKDLYFV